MRKVLYSPGFGAGWTTWNESNKEVAKYMLEYQPIIEFIDAGGSFSRDDLGGYGATEADHPLLKQLQAECREKFGATYICLLGAPDLVVAEVSGRVRIEEYDGSESLEEEGSFSGWM